MEDVDGDKAELGKDFVEEMVCGTSEHLQLAFTLTS